MKRRLADFVLWLLAPLTDWCYRYATWIPIQWEPEEEDDPALVLDE